MAKNERKNTQQKELYNPGNSSSLCSVSVWRRIATGNASFAKVLEARLLYTASHKDFPSLFEDSSYSCTLQRKFFLSQGGPPP